MFLSSQFCIEHVPDHFINVVEKASLQNVINTTRIVLDPPIEETLQIR